MDSAELIKITLQAAVPMWVEEFKNRPFAQLHEIAARAAEVIAEKGDVLQFGSKRKGEAANAFNALARGLAALSFVPGGVTFSGLHFENVHPDGIKR